MIKKKFPRCSIVHWAFILSFLSVLLFESCNKQENDNPPITHQQGEISQVTQRGTLSPAQIQGILSSAGVQIPFTLSWSVKIIAVNYYSVNHKGDEILVSGAIFVPQQAGNLPMLSIQHGTESKRDRVASVSPTNSTEGIVALITASMGYLTIVPDYPGFGVSTINHPYLHAGWLVPCAIDFLRAARFYASANQIGLDGRIFLTGYSEGGYLTLVMQKVLEEDYAGEFTLTAVAPISGPYDLKGTVDTILENYQYTTPAYGAYLFTMYNEIYQWDRLSGFFQSPYNTMMPGLFNGTKTWGEITNQLPPSLSDLIQPAFRTNYLNGDEPELTTALTENTILDWIPQTPIHFFHGDADEVVPYQNVLTAIQSLTDSGTPSILLTTIPGGTHETTGPIAVIGAIQWFESL